MKILKKIINRLEKFERLSEENQIKKLKQVKKRFPKLRIFIGSEELK